jgi:hypothetical protein
MPDPASLEQLYRDAIYEVDLPAGTVVLRVGGRGPAGLPRPLAIVTAWNPGMSRPARAENEAANRQLEAAIAGAGWVAFRARGRDVAATHVEPSFAIAGISRERALALGRQFAQSAIVYCGRGPVELLWCIPPGE